jgi:hypothetical protein
MLTLLPIMAVVFMAFFITGLTMPVLPLHVHQGLGISTFVVGLVGGAQFAAALRLDAMLGRAHRRDSRRRCSKVSARPQALAWRHTEDRNDAYRHSGSVGWQGCRVDGKGHGRTIRKIMETIGQDKWPVNVRFWPVVRAQHHGSGHTSAGIPPNNSVPASNPEMKHSKSPNANSRKVTAEQERYGEGRIFLTRSGVSLKAS